MVCTQCGAKTQIINSRPQRRTNQVWRRRQCLNCRTTFTTEENIVYANILVVRGRSGRLRPFSRDKLFLSLYTSCGHRSTAVADATALTDTLTTKLAAMASEGLLTNDSIAQAAQVLLNRFDKAASVHYQAHHRS